MIFTYSPFYFKARLFTSLNLVCCLLLLNCKNDKKTVTKVKQSNVSCHSDFNTTKAQAIPNGIFKAHKVKMPILIDGCSKDAIWQAANWYDLNYIWMGDKVDFNDYHGKFKLAWDTNYLYILVEVVDDILTPTLQNGVENYWKGDYVEVFLDEDCSGGNHKFNHQAFAYHVSTEGHAIDKNTKNETVFFDSHVTVKRSQNGNVHHWEMAIKIFDKQFDDTKTDNTPVNIVKNKRIGFSLAYGDNDGANTRENFMGSKKTHGVNNDEGYINSDVFGEILCID